jgi:hypothetical protein
MWIKDVRGVARQRIELLPRPVPNATFSALAADKYMTLNWDHHERVLGL